jgi:hypothetical protein
MANLPMFGNFTKLPPFAVLRPAESINFDDISSQLWGGRILDLDNSATTVDSTISDTVLFSAFQARIAELGLLSHTDEDSCFNGITKLRSSLDPQMSAQTNLQTAAIRVAAVGGDEFNSGTVIGHKPRWYTS